MGRAMAVRMPVAVGVTMITKAEQQRTGDVDGKAKTGNRNGLGEMNRHRREDAADGLVADQHCNHCQDDRTGESRQIAEFSSPEREARVVGVLAGVGVGERGEQQCAGVRAHMQTIRDESDGAEQRAADDFRDHHGSAKPDHGPHSALALFVAGTQEYVRMPRRGAGNTGLAHGKPHLR